MTVDDYKFNMRKYRGALKSVDTELETIYLAGTERFINYTLASKDMGVSKLAYITDNLTVAQQDEFLDWLTDKKRFVNEIDLKLTEII